MTDQNNKIKILSQITNPQTSWLKRYRQLFCGETSFLYLIKYELIMMLFANFPGALGLALRKIFYPVLFAKVGKGVVFGRSVTLRHPKKIEIGDHVIIDDYAVLDAKGDEGIRIVIGNHVFISRDVILGSKNGHIQIGHHITIGPHAIIQSVSVAHVKIGDYSVIAPHVYVIGAGNYDYKKTDMPMSLQPLAVGQGVEIEEDVWIGSSAVISDGSKIRKGAVIGALSFVKGEIPSYAVAFGCPAQVKHSRQSS